MRNIAHENNTLSMFNKFTLKHIEIIKHNFKLILLSNIFLRHSQRKSKHFLDSHPI